MTGEQARRDVQDWDIITLSGLKAVANHGVYDFEREGSQDFIADITLFVDARKAAQTDDVSDTVDYSRVAEDAVNILTGPAVYLIETLASRLAELALTYPGVRRVAVTIHKPMAPLKQQFSDVSVTVLREHQDVTGPNVVAQAMLKRTRPVAPPKPRQRRPRVEVSATSLPQAPRAAAAAPSVLAVTQLEAPKPPSSPIPVEPRVEPRVEPGLEPKAAATTKRAKPRGVEAKLAFADRKRPAKVVYQVVLALGGNRGDTVANLRGAVEAIANLDGFEVEAVSPLVRTKPVLEKGALPQEDYLNAVVLGRTVMAPPALLAATQKIETNFGRVRATRWGARTLDIDIISLDRMRLNTRTLTLPHPRAHSRAFVLYPWMLVDSDGYLAGAGSVRELLPLAQDLQGIIAQYPQWLVGDGRGGLGVEEILELAPRGPEVAHHFDASIPTRQVTLRGEPVRLAGVKDDPIFQGLLEAEGPSHAHIDVDVDVDVDVDADTAWHPVFTTGSAQEDRVPSSQSVRDVQEPHTTGKIPVISRRAARTVEFPTRRSIVKATSERDTEIVELPEWDFTTRPQAPRVVDSVDREEQPLAPTSQVPKVSRNVTMRPTPTGSIPVRREPDAVTQG